MIPNGDDAPSLKHELPRGRHVDRFLDIAFAKWTRISFVRDRITSTGRLATLSVIAFFEEFDFWVKQSESKSMLWS